MGALCTFSIESLGLMQFIALNDYLSSDHCASSSTDFILFDDTLSLSNMY